MSGVMTWFPGATTTMPQLVPIVWPQDVSEEKMLMTVPVARKQQIGLSSLTEGRYRLLKPYLLLEMERAENGRVLVWEERSGAYGVGHNQAEAVQDFQSMLEEMYEHLSEAESSLSHALYGRLTYLRSIIAPY